MANRKLEVIYNEGIFGHGEFKIFNTKEINEFPEDVKMKTNIAVVIFSLSDLDWFKNLEGTETIDDSDYRIVRSASSDGKYIELTDMGFMYAKKHLDSGLVLYDPTGELKGKWNIPTFKKK